jgi:hypothetical protein
MKQSSTGVGGKSRFAGSRAHPRESAKEGDASKAQKAWRKPNSPASSHETGQFLATWHFLRAI